jgi:hypothetical protein
MTESEKHAQKLARMRKYGKEIYYPRNKAEINKKTTKYAQDNPEIMKKATYGWRQRKQAQIKEILCVKCVICGSEKSIVYHEKNGLNHASFGYMSQNPAYILKNIQNFTPLCRWCHGYIHNAERTKNFDINQLLSLITQLKKNSQNSLSLPITEN